MPLLILASDSEVLRDDAVRFADAARAAGSAVRLRLFSGESHAWPVIAPEAAAATHAFEGALRDFLPFARSPRKATTS